MQEKYDKCKCGHNPAIEPNQFMISDFESFDVILETRAMGKNCKNEFKLQD